MKRKLNIVIGLLLILIGIGLFIVPRLSMEMLRKESNKAVASLTEMTTEQFRENATREVEYDFEAISSINVEQSIRRSILGSQDTINQYKDDIVGQMIIEDLNINLVLFNGINDPKLYVGVTTMKPGQVFGQGNYAIAGHWSSVDDVLLARLPEIQLGTIIKLTDKENVYEYKVYKAELVLATDIHLIEDAMATQHGKPIVSVMSCYYTNHDTHRWFAFGELVNVYPYES